MTNAKPHRNAPCWCGSGKKYKQCHLEMDLQAAAETNAPGVSGARDIFEIRDSILGPRQVRSDEVGSPRQAPEGRKRRPVRPVPEPRCYHLDFDSPTT